MARRKKEIPNQGNEESNLEKNVDMETKKTRVVVKKAVKTKPSLFSQVAPENFFVLCDGRVIKDYAELAGLLETMNDDIFYYHVTSDRNDFANWINDVFKEETLANEVRLSKNRVEIIALLYKNLFEKSKKLLDQS